MVQRLTILSGLIISATCSVLPLIPIQLHLVPVQQQHQPQQYQRQQQQQYQQQPQEVHTPDYSFSYNVDDDHTGDVKHQQETRHGGTVTGQYSLIQPNGVRRVVDYRADDATGFLATVNNERNQVDRQSENAKWEDEQQWQIQPQNTPNVTPAPMAISRSSIVQHIQSRRIVHPWA